LLAGTSRGGILSVVYASRRPDSVKGVINFVGIWNDDRCPDINDQLFTEAARSIRTPTLWLYAEGDRMISKASAIRYSSSFQNNGGMLTFRLYSHDFGNGHALLLKGERFWLSDLDIFLSQLGYFRKP
jgi:pimeloyl-ACP methyl ester carboxylesterase